MKKKMGDYKIFNFNSKYYLFIVESVAIFEIDEALKYVLENSSEYLNEELLDSKDREEICNILEKAGLYNETIDNVYINDSNEEVGISSVILLLSQACNLRCTYCYAEGGEYHNKGFMTEEVAYKAIDYIFDYSKRKKVNVTFFGGEPLLKFELLKDCVDYAIKRATETDKEVVFSITTNGTLINKEIGEYLEKYRFNITLSIDGDKITHNKNRFDIHGNGTYKTVLENVSKYVGCENVTARATLTSFNTDIQQIYDSLYTLGFGKVNISPSINMMDDKAYKDLENSYKKLVTKFVEAANEKNYDYCKKTGMVIAALDRYHKGGVRRKYCGAVNNIIAVDIDGTIYGCHRLVNAESSQFGNVFSGYDETRRKALMKEIVQDAENEGCRKCWARSLCGGGCPSENDVANNDFKKPHKQTCELYKKNQELFLETYINFTEEQKRIILEG